MTTIELKKQGLFTTPKDQKQITDWIELHPAEMRMSMYTVYGMTWNLIAKWLEEENVDS